MSLDMHAVATSMVATQHLAAGANKSDEANRAAQVRAAVAEKESARAEDSLDLTPKFPIQLPGGFQDLLDAVDAARQTSEEILGNPMPSLLAQANSTPETVYQLVA